MSNPLNYDYNFHTHTTRCGHAVGSDRDYVLKAIEGGITTLGFSDHTYIKDFTEPGIRMNEDLFPEYRSSILALKEEFKDQVDIYLGLECEYTPYMTMEFTRLLKENQVDYLILGQHMRFINPNEKGVNYFKLGPKLALIAYIDDVIKGIETGLFLYIAHPDLFGYFYQVADSFGESEVNRLLMKIEEYQIPVELNISKLANNLRHKLTMFHNAPFPNYLFWTLMKGRNIPVVIGLDAHDPRGLVDSPLFWASEFIKDYNLHYVGKDYLLKRAKEIKEKLK